MDFNQFQALQLPMISLGGDQKELSQNRAEAFTSVDPRPRSLQRTRSPHRPNKCHGFKAVAANKGADPGFRPLKLETEEDESRESYGEPAMKVFTTGQVAKICKVAPRTVSKWFDSGRLKGYRIPGSQDRRIPREYLIRFLKEHGMPLGDLEDEAMAKVLIVAQDQVLIENMKRELPPERAFRVAVAASGFEAGIQAESFHPDCICVDFSIGKVEALQICQNLRRNSDFSDTILIALLPDDGQPMSFDRSSINETFKKPFDARLLAERLRTLIGAKKELV
jgi:excisionase family DNA binding protein